MNGPIFSQNPKKSQHKGHCVQSKNPWCSSPRTLCVVHRQPTVQKRWVLQSKDFVWNAKTLGPAAVQKRWVLQSKDFVCSAKTLDPAAVQKLQGAAVRDSRCSAVLVHETDMSRSEKSTPTYRGNGQWLGKQHKFEPTQEEAKYRSDYRKYLSPEMLYIP